MLPKTAQTAVVAGLAALLLSACTTQESPIAIGHVVLISLSDDAQTEALVADCDRLLRPIPSVGSFAVGPALDTGREAVVDDYDVGIVMTFSSPEGYTEYIEHPNHVELVETWGSRFASIRVYDVDDSSAAD